jgi:hypothetical protein
MFKTISNNISLSRLCKTNISSIFSKASSANVQAIFSNQTLSGKAHSAALLPFTIDGHLYRNLLGERTKHCREP